jgi:hypothetical protein
MEVVMRMSIEKYISLAKCNKKQSNYNKIYRDTEALVATDGFRMHWIDNLPVENKSTGLFTDWRQGVPKYTTQLFLVNRVQIDSFFPILNFLAKDKFNNVTVTKSQVIPKTIDFTHEHYGTLIKFNCSVDYLNDSFESFKINAKFLNDALAKFKSINLNDASVMFKKCIKNDIITIDSNYYAEKAVIMTIK